MQLLNALPRQPFLGLATAASTGILVTDFAPNHSLAMVVALGILALTALAFAQFVYGLCPRSNWVLYPAQPEHERFASAAPCTRTRRETAPHQRSWTRSKRTEDFAERLGFIPFAGGIH
jgi:hypothetical protein